MMNIEYFNCGGYALETYEWFEFYTKEDNEEVKSIFEELKLNKNDEGLRERIIYQVEGGHFSDINIQKYCVMELLKRTPRLRPILNYHELRKNEYGVALRFSEDDFHFVKYKNHKFSHKRGELKPIELPDEYKGWLGERENDQKYYSKIYRFAMRTA